MRWKLAMADIHFIIEIFMVVPVKINDHLGCDGM
jgi:hypothetical protein